jgi:hypothetical protein
VSKEIPELGEIAYVGYFKASDGKSLVSGAPLPAWDEQSPDIRRSWNLAAMAVVDRWREAGDGEERLPDDAPLRYALVEQMGFRRAYGTVRETELVGKKMLEVTELGTGQVRLVGGDSLYQVTWLTRDQAERGAGVHAVAALPAADLAPWGVEYFDEGDSKREATDAQTLADSPGSDLDDEAERDDVLRMRREMACEAGDDFAGRPRDSMEDGE